MNEKEISAKLTKLNADQLEEVNQLIDKFLAVPKPKVTENLADIIEKFHIPENYQLAIVEHSDDFSIEKAPVIIWNADEQFHILNVLDLSLLGQIDIPLSDIEKITYYQNGQASRYGLYKWTLYDDPKYKKFINDFWKFACDVVTKDNEPVEPGCGGYYSSNYLLVSGKYKISFSPQSFGSLIKVLNKPVAFMGNFNELSPSYGFDIFKLMTFHQYFVVDDQEYSSKKDKLIHQYCDPLTDINEIKKNIHLAFDKKMLTEQESNDYLQGYLNR